MALRLNDLAATLKMPFNDCFSNPDPHKLVCPRLVTSNWEYLSIVDLLIYMYPFLRHEDEFWKELPPQDAKCLSHTQLHISCTIEKLRDYDVAEKKQEAVFCMSDTRSSL